MKLWVKESSENRSNRQLFPTPASSTSSYLQHAWVFYDKIYSTQHIHHYFVIDNWGLQIHENPVPLKTGAYEPIQSDNDWMITLSLNGTQRHNKQLIENGEQAQDYKPPPNQISMHKQKSQQKVPTAHLKFHHAVWNSARPLCTLTRATVLRCLPLSPISNSLIR